MPIAKSPLLVTKHRNKFLENRHPDKWDLSGVCPSSQDFGQTLALRDANRFSRLQSAVLPVNIEHAGHCPRAKSGGAGRYALR
jgi:hypothetical protein